MTFADDRVTGRRRWQLNREALDRLLGTFDSDREVASRRYEALRRRLIDLFAWEGSELPEDLADETLDRLARRLSEGVQLEPGQVERYAFGIARFLLLETARARRARETAMRDLPQPPEPDDGAEMLQALGHCLEQLPAENRRLIEAYYTTDRESLARSLGISLNALRNRAMRIRQQLHDCVVRLRDV